MTPSLIAPNPPADAQVEPACPKPRDRAARDRAAQDARTSGSGKLEIIIAGRVARLDGERAAASAVAVDPRNAQPLPFIPMRGALGFFAVPPGAVEAVRTALRSGGLAGF